MAASSADFCVKSIVKMVFKCYNQISGCDYLVSVTIGSSVRASDHAFPCESLIEIINKSSLEISGSYIGGSLIGLGNNVKDVITDKSQSSLKTVGEYIFYDDGTDIYLVKYFGNDEDILLPEYDGGKQYGIYKDAFYSNDNIKSVVIPNCVTNIGRNAFYSCSSLEKLIIPDSVISVDDYAFYLCSCTIYCEAESQPNGWSTNWGYHNCSLVWGYKPE